MNGSRGWPTTVRGALLAIVAWTWIAAAGEANAAKDKAMCAGLTGALHGLCTAGAALECGAGTSNQQQCDKLADKFEGIAGSPPPWEEPPPPPGEGVEMVFDLDALHLETGEQCHGAIEGPCIDDDALRPIAPNDFWVSVDDDGGVLLIPAVSCGEADPTHEPAVARLANTPFASVTSPEGLPFVEEQVEVTFGELDTLVFRTCMPRYFKIGILQRDENTVTLDIAEISF